MKTNKKYEAKIRKMSLIEAKIELNEWRESYHAESQNAVPDEEYLDKCICYGGFIGSHIHEITNKLYANDNEDDYK